MVFNFLKLQYILLFAIACKGSSQKAIDTTPSKGKTTSQIDATASGTSNSGCTAAKCDPIPVSVFTSGDATTLVGQVGSQISWSFRAETVPATDARQVKLVIIDVPTGLTKQGSGAGAVLSGTINTTANGTIRAFARDVTFCKQKFPQNTAQCDGESQLQDIDTAKTFSYSIQQLQQTTASNPTQPITALPQQDTMGCVLGSALPGVLSGNIVGVLAGSVGCLLK